MSEAGHPPLSGAKLVLAAAALSFGNFMVVLDTTIANVAMPTISGDLGVSTTEGTWIITAYAVAEAITVPLTGWLARRFGEVRLFSVCVVAFVITSILCGLSGSLEMLVLFRILQGFVGGPLIPLSATLLMSVFPKEKSNVALAIWGLTTVVAPIFGPILGGYISDNYIWGWIFYINIPFGAAVGGVTWWLMRNRETAIERKRIDVVGLLLLVVFVSAFQLMIDKGRELDWFSSDFIVGSAIVAFISLVALIIWELTDEDPVLDFSVFRSRNWVVSTVSLGLMFGLFFGNIVLTPLVASADDGIYGDLGGPRDSADGHTCGHHSADCRTAHGEDRSETDRQLWHGGPGGLLLHARAVSMRKPTTCPSRSQCSSWGQACRLVS